MYSDLILQTQAAIRIYCHLRPYYTPSGCSTFIVNVRHHQDAANNGKGYKTFMFLVVKASNPFRLSKKDDIFSHLVFISYII